MIRINFAAKILLCFLLITVLCAPIGNTKEKKKKQSNRLPPAPDTGSPEGDFSAGGTRDNRLQSSWCSSGDQQAAYLLGNRSREFTQVAHPTFWFNFPDTKKEVAKVSFLVTELKTGNKIYERSIPHPERAGIVGISLPEARKYDLTPETNYSWTLKVRCADEEESKIALEGWVSRETLDSQLQSQLASTPKLTQHEIYVQQNLWYDALTTIAQHHITQSNHDETKTAWDRFLAELGWRELAGDNATVPMLLDSNLQTNSER